MKFLVTTTAGAAGTEAYLRMIGAVAPTEKVVALPSKSIRGAHDLYVVLPGETVATPQPAGAMTKKKKPHKPQPKQQAENPWLVTIVVTLLFLLFLRACS